MKNWENIVIETGIDTLMTYLSQNGEASLSRISNDTGISQQRLKNWADSLEKEGLLEKEYTYRKGIVLRYTKQNKEETEERKDELEEDLEEHSEQLSDEMKQRLDDLRDTKKELRTIATDLEEQQEDEDEIKNKIDAVEDLEEELESQLDEIDDIKEQDIKTLQDVEETLEDIEEVENEKFAENRDAVRAKLKALSKLEDHIQNYENNIQEESGGIVSRITSFLPGGAGSKNTTPQKESEETGQKDDEENESGIKKTPEINQNTDIEEVEASGHEDKEPRGSETGSHPVTVDHIEDVNAFIYMLNNSNIEQSKEMIQMIENPDYEELLELEEQAKDRKTLKKWIKQRTE